MTKIWLITDTHFGHSKLTEYCNRPPNFSNNILKELQIVKQDDVLIHLGDFCFGEEENWHNTFHNYVQGKKILIKGNHDNKSNSWYFKHGWDFVCDSFTLTVFGKKILFSHVPLSRRKHGDYDLNIHGHFHNSKHRRHELKYRIIKNKKHKLLAIENTNYQPILLKTFLGL